MGLVRLEASLIHLPNSDGQGGHLDRLIEFGIPGQNSSIRWMG